MYTIIRGLYAVLKLRISSAGDDTKMPKVPRLWRRVLHGLHEATCQLVTLSTRHKWAQNKAVKRNYLLVGEVAPETVLTNSAVTVLKSKPKPRF